MTRFRDLGGRWTMQARWWFNLFNRSALRPPVRHLVQILQPFILQLFAGKYFGDLLKPVQSLILPRILQEDLGLHDEIFERLHSPAFFGARSARVPNALRSRLRLCFRR